MARKNTPRERNRKPKQPRPSKSLPLPLEFRTAARYCNLECPQSLWGRLMQYRECGLRVSVLAANPAMIKDWAPVERLTIVVFVILVYLPQGDKQGQVQEFWNIARKLWSENPSEFPKLIEYIVQEGRFPARKQKSKKDVLAAAA